MKTDRSLVVITRELREAKVRRAHAESEAARWSDLRSQAREQVVVLAAELSKARAKYYGKAKN